ncbi:Gfo/Idh/MocA family oxidoreductase [Micromonospora lupini]|uniref:Gfo/Idh/MocA family protein n=1 Tax=Micromonospora lupini TaxID=285679 RepID=UPI0033D802AF
MGNEPLRVGQVGLGWFGGIHAQTWPAVAGAELVAVCDADPTRLQPNGGGDAQDSFHVDAGHGQLRLPDSVARFNDLDDLLGSGIDLLDVVVSEQAHADVVRRGLLAGVDVIVEKPIALDLADVRELIDVARTVGRNLYVGHILRFDVRNAALAGMVDAGGLRHMSFQRNFQTAAHQVYGRIHPVFGAAIHDIDLAVWYAGRRPNAISAFTSSFLGAATPDVLDIVLHWDDGLRAVIQNSWHVAAACPFGFEFECKVQTAGATYVLRNEPDLHVWDAAGVRAPEMHFWPLSGETRAGAIRAELQHYADCSRDGIASPRVPLEQVLWCAEIADTVITATAGGAEGSVRL